MADLEHIPQTYEDACSVLARSHAEEVQFPIRVYCFPDPTRQEVRLVEISNSFPENVDSTRYAARMDPGPGEGPAQAKLVVPVVTLRPSDDFPFRSSVALVTEAEWERILAGDLRIGGKWRTDDRYQIWPQ
ncbi:MAG: hypothetical protein HY718_13400 [Planctomycetes bacterium]|nr:hypothetical protein [Planctomycetota bacterium]